MFYFYSNDWEKIDWSNQPPTYEQLQAAKRLKQQQAVSRKLQPLSTLPKSIQESTNQDNNSG